MTSPKVSRQYCLPIHFGEYEINPSNGELRKRGMLIRLPSKAARVLLSLLEEPGRICTREELKQTLWPGDTYGDFDHGLNKCIYSLRVALGDIARRPQLIETLNGQGYRFIGAVRAQSEDAPCPRSWLEMPIAVMPFAVDSPELNLLSARIAAQAIDELSPVRGLKVLAYSQVCGLRSREDGQALQERFGAQSTVVGDLKRDGDDLYVHAEMVDSLNGTQIWGMHMQLSMTRDSAERIAAGIIARVKAAKAEEEKARGSEAGMDAAGWRFGRKLMGNWHTFGWRRTTDRPGELFAKRHTGP